MRIKAVLRVAVASGLLLAIALGAASYGRLHLGFGETRTARPAEALRFVPDVHEFGKSPLFSGDRIHFETAVENVSAAPIILTTIPRSCGCLTFGQSGGLKLPVTLRPGERFPLRVEVATDGKTGYQRMEIQALGRKPEGEAVPTARLAIQGNVWSSILPLPEELFVEVDPDTRNKPVVRKVLLADEWPGDGLVIAKITSTAGKRLQFDLAPAEGKAMVRGLDVTKRKEMTIRYAIPEGAETFDETITITPARSDAKPATIRLHGRVVPDFEMHPNRVVVTETSEGATASRVLTYQFRDPEFRDCRVVETPKGVTVAEISVPLKNSRRFRVTCELPEQAGAQDGTLVFQVGNRIDSIRVPVSMIRRTHD
jgi:hypothetical protein